MNYYYYDDDDDYYDYYYYYYYYYPLPLTTYRLHLTPYSLLLTPYSLLLTTPGYSQLTTQHTTTYRLQPLTTRHLCARRCPHRTMLLL